MTKRYVQMWEVVGFVGGEQGVLVGGTVGSPG